MNNFYEILGISKDADEKTIKKAYKALARKYHPDRNPGNKDAEEKFKQVQKAYETLSNPNKRRIYDMGGSQHGFNPFSGIHGFDFGASPNDLNELINNFFKHGNAARAYQQDAAIPRGSDVGLQLQLELEEVLIDSTKEITFQRNVRCDACNATGAKAEPDAIITCQECNGRGYIARSNGFMQIVTTCNVCSGSGKVVNKSCDVCHGNKLVSKIEQLKIKIPKGTRDGNALRISGKGNESVDKNKRNGDVFVRIAIKPHNTFNRQNDDLYVKLKIPYTVAVLGGEIEVPVLGDKPGKYPTIKVNLPNGIAKKKVLEIEKRGIPNIQSGQRGKQIVYMDVEIPEASTLSERQKELLLEFHCMKQ